MTIFRSHTPWNTISFFTTLPGIPHHFCLDQIYFLRPPGIPLSSTMTSLEFSNFKHDHPLGIFQISFLRPSWNFRYPPLFGLKSLGRHLGAAPQLMHQREWKSFPVLQHSHYKEHIAINQIACQLSSEIDVILDSDKMMAISNSLTFRHWFLPSL